MRIVKIERRQNKVHFVHVIGTHNKALIVYRDNRLELHSIYFYRTLLIASNLIRLFRFVSMSIMFLTNDVT